MAESKYITRDDAQIHYRVIGRGMPIVLLHGFGETGEVWMDWLNPFSHNYSFIVPDLPGFGKSSLPSHDLRIELIADIIMTIMHEEKLENALMIGHSMGGYVTLALEEKYPDMLTGLGLMHSTAEADSEEKRQNRQKAIRFIEQYGNELFVDEFIPNLFAPSFVHQRPEVVENMKGNAKHLPSQTLIASYKAMMQRSDRKHVLRDATKPTLFVGGKEDTIVPSRDILNQAVLPQKSDLFLFDDTGHMGMIEKKEQTQNALIHFLDMIEPEK